MKTIIWIFNIIVQFTLLIALLFNRRIFTFDSVLVTKVSGFISGNGIGV